MDKTDALLALGTALQGAQIYSAFNPSVFTIREFGANRSPATVQDIRQGEAIATGFMLLMGAVISGIADNSVPMVVAIIVSIFMVSVYEWALRTPRKEAE